MIKEKRIKKIEKGNKGKHKTKNEKGRKTKIEIRFIYNTKKCKLTTKKSK